jgi:hypothetical protein
MVLSEQLLPERGQEFRDRVRCIELQRLGFNVCTVDDKHNDDYLFPGLHYCNANFNNYRGFFDKFEISGEEMCSSKISFWTIFSLR